MRRKQDSRMLNQFTLKFNDQNKELEYQMTKAKQLAPFHRKYQLFSLLMAFLVIILSIVVSL